jgi:outer membrane protein assembly factor BamB
LRTIYALTDGGDRSLVAVSNPDTIARLVLDWPGRDGLESFLRGGAEMGGGVRHRKGHCGLLALLVALTLATPSAAADWPMFMRDARHTGLSTETTIAASNVSSLTFQWVVNTGAPTFVSPAVVSNATLGKTLVYTANQAGTVSAYDAATGERLWWFDTPSMIASSPAVVGNRIYFGASDHKVYALNATTGGFACSFETGGVVASSPVVVNPDGKGNVVYIGDNGLSGADDGGHVWAIQGSDCSLKWVFDSFGEPPGSADLAGSWTPIAFARDVTGRPLIFFGGSSSDSGVYAVDARTGARVWRFQSEVFSQDDDVGTGPTISPAGMNGFADGVVYINAKNRIVYALNLRTGARLWRYSIRDNFPTVGGSTRSTAALVGARLYLGYGAGLLALNAKTGTKIWSSQPTVPEVIASPVVSGPAGDRVAFAGDLGGALHAYDLATGLSRWNYRTGGFIYGSAALAANKAFVGSSDGFLYAFGFGGGVSAKPQTTLTNPANNSTVPNPNGNLEVSGAATDDQQVQHVLVAVKNSNSGQWWDATAGRWVGVFTQNEATLTSAGRTSTSWKASFPVPFAGGPFYAQAEAVDQHGQHDPTVASARFTLPSLGNPPETSITSPVNRQVFHFTKNSDGSVNRTSFPITISGTATDTQGPRPGVSRVVVVVKNWEHNEYYCGPAACPGEPSEFWRPQWISFKAALGAPGATSTNWSASFPVYDHPHAYRIEAWSVDNDAEPDSTHSVVYPVCVRDPGMNFCQ